MQSHITAFNQKPHAAGSAKPSRPHQPVRLPLTTAELIERMLSARCGAGVAAPRS